MNEEVKPIAHLTLKSLPGGSILHLPTTIREEYLREIVDLPDDLQQFISRKSVGAYIRGLSKSYRLTEDKIPVVALTVLNVVIGKVGLSQLSAALSTNLALSGDAAQKMAREIEGDLLAPIKDRFGKVRSEDESQKAKPVEVQGAAESNNILDLKEQLKPPAPPPMPSNKE